MSRCSSKAKSWKKMLLSLKNAWIRMGITMAVTLLLLLFYQKSKSSKRLDFHPPPEEEVFIRSPVMGEPLGNLPKAMCLVMTTPLNHRDRARHVAATWGLKDKNKDQNKDKSKDKGEGFGMQYQESCPDTVFVTSAPHPDLPSAIFTDYSSYEDIWGKVLVAFRSVNISRADWFMKVDDDTFVIYPRLQRLLARFDARQPIILGYNLIYSFEDGREIEYMSGGAGYLLSAPAVKLLQNTRLKECQFPGTTSYEDVNMGTCMTALGVKFGDTRDLLGRPVFLPYPPQTFFNPDSGLHPDISWMNSLSKYPVKFGTQHLSDQVVSFHEIRNPLDTYLLQYFIHHLRLQSPSEANPFINL